MPTLSGLPDIWDLYQQMGSIGWTPPGGIEGSKPGGWSTSGNAAWQGASKPSEPINGNPDTGMMDLMAQQRAQAPNLGGSRSYFPNANPQRQSNQTYSLPSGGSVTVPSGSAIPSGFTQSQFPNVLNTAQPTRFQPKPNPNVSTYTLPSGGTVGIPKGSRLPSGYSQARGGAPGELTGPYKPTYGVPSQTTNEFFPLAKQPRANPVPNESMYASSTRPRGYFDY